MFLTATFRGNADVANVAIRGVITNIDVTFGRGVDTKPLLE